MKTTPYIASSFSIIFKAESFLEHLLKNIEEQENFNEIQFIFINPNSPDGSEKILLPYLDKYPNFKYIKLDKDPGLYECWNIAVRNSDSEYVTNWNPDDRRTVDSIKSLHDSLVNNKEYDLAYGLTFVTKNKNENLIDCKSQQIWPVYPHNFYFLYFHNSPHCMPMWKKEIHEKYGFFDNSYISAGDGEMWLRIVLKGSNFLFLNKIVGSYYESDYSVSRNKEKLPALLKEVYDMRCSYLKKIMGINNI
jgi:hypothetical protein